jgi:hypothetical protein
MKLYTIRVAIYGEAITVATYESERKARSVLEVLNRAAQAIASKGENRQPKEFVLEVIETDDVLEGV